MASIQSAINNILISSAVGATAIEKGLKKPDKPTPKDVTRQQALAKSQKEIQNKYDQVTEFRKRKEVMNKLKIGGAIDYGKK